MNAHSQSYEEFMPGYYREQIEAIAKHFQLRTDSVPTGTLLESIKIESERYAEEKARKKHE